MKKQILQGILPNLIKSGTCLENLFFWSEFENCFLSDVHHTLREIWPVFERPSGLRSNGAKYV